MVMSSFTKVHKNTSLKATNKEQIVDEELPISYENGVNFVELSYVPQGIVSMYIPTPNEDVIINGSPNVAHKRVEFLEGIDHSKDILVVRYLTTL